jgi:hypothetical protein
MKKFSIFIILILSLSQPLQAASNPMGDMMSAMFRMMTAMANHMAGSFGGSSSLSAGSNFGSGFNPWMGGMGGMPGMWPGSGMTPWSTMPSGGFPPGASPGLGMPPNPRWQQGPPPPYPNRTTAARSPLEGNWLSQSGEALQVRNNRFRLRSREGVLSGTLRLENNNHLKLFVPQARLVMPYRYKRKRGALMLQHTSGQVLYFKQQPPSRY